MNAAPDTTPAPIRLKSLHDAAYGHCHYEEERVVSQKVISDALLFDKSDVVRHEAAFLLGDLARTKTLFNQGSALADLITASRDPSVLVRHEVALSLANFKPSEAQAVLLQMATDQAKEVVSSVRYAMEDLILRLSGGAA